MGHWNKLKAQAKVARRKAGPDLNAAIDALPEVERLAAMDRLRQAIIAHLMGESVAVIAMLAEAYRSTALGDAIATALENKGIIPDEFVNPSRRIRRDV